MNGPLPDVRATARPNGLIDTIWAGFSAVNRNVWLLVIPILIDVGLLLGPQVTGGPLLETVLRQAAPPPNASSELVRAMEDGRRSSLEVLDKQPAIKNFNLVSLLTVVSLMSVPIIGVPSFQAGTPGQGPLMPLESAVGVAATVFLCTTIGICLAAVFYGMLGQAVREGRAAPSRMAADLPPTLLWTAALFLLMLFLVFGGFTVAFLLTLTRGAIPALAALMGPLILGVMLWAFVYLFFTAVAVFVSQVPPLVAARQSILVVRNNFWSTLGFIGLVLIIWAGLPIIWNGIADNLHGPGIAIAILGHIYISSGLAAAMMTYYKERFERLT